MMNRAAAFAAPMGFDPDFESVLPVGVQLRRFLDGETDGNGLLTALYGHVAAEPVPERLTAILRRH